MFSANQVQLLEAKFENECGSWFEILEYVPLASQTIPWPIIGYVSFYKGC